MLIIGMEQNLCTEKEIHEFDKLPFKNKIFFSSKNLPEVKSNIAIGIGCLQSNCFVAEFEEKGEIGDPYKMGHVLYRYIENLKIKEKNDKRPKMIQLASQTY